MRGWLKCPPSFREPAPVVVEAGAVVCRWEGRRSGGIGPLSVLVDGDQFRWSRRRSRPGAWRLTRY